MNALTAAKRFWDQPDLYAPALGCSTCPLKDGCGSIHCKSSIFDCHDFCCGGQSDCSTVCRLNPTFLDQFCEVRGFRLIAPLVQVDEPAFISSIIPMLYHTSGRERVVTAKRVAIRLREVLDLQTGETRFSSREALCKGLQISPEAEIIVSGVDHDPQVEAVWALSDTRRTAFEAMRALELTAITTPNFSLLLDRPREDNLHAMKRIGLLYNELAEAGLPAVLHPNSRTEHDMERWWSEFIEPRPWLMTLSYEFGTGSGIKGRMEAHCDWLNSIASKRPMQIIVRGNPESIKLLTKFKEIVYIESTSFMKSVKRQWPSRTGNQRLNWETREASYFDEHLEQAINEVGDLLRNRYGRDWDN